MNRRMFGLSLLCAACLRKLSNRTRVKVTTYDTKTGRIQYLHTDAHTARDRPEWLIPASRVFIAVNKV